MSGSPCPIEIMRQVVDRMGVREITIAYGQTEASPIITQTRADDPLEMRVETVGRPMPGVEVKIVDPGHRRDAARQPAGRAVRPRPRRDAGLLQEPRGHRTRPSTPDGWLHTGDLAVRLPTAITASPAGSKTW